MRPGKLSRSPGLPSGVPRFLAVLCLVLPGTGCRESPAGGALQVDPDFALLEGRGDTLRLTARAPRGWAWWIRDGARAGARWTSLDPWIAVVDPHTGLVQAIGPGAARIVYERDGQADTAVVGVGLADPAAAPSSSPEQVRVAVRGTGPHRIDLRASWEPDPEAPTPAASRVRAWVAEDLVLEISEASSSGLDFSVERRPRGEAGVVCVWWPDAAARPSPACRPFHVPAAAGPSPGPLESVAVGVVCGYGRDGHTFDPRRQEWILLPRCRSCERGTDGRCLDGGPDTVPRPSP